MKKLINPTTHFFEQADRNSSQPPSPQIEQFVRSLINMDRCELCREEYDVKVRVPRILIHCGHTFCSLCLEGFFMKNRVRCPMCLKLVKQLSSLQRLPINHTIFTHLLKKGETPTSSNSPPITDASKFLYTEFERVQKQAHRQEHPTKYDDESGLPFCVFHGDRVEHFYCQTHKSFGCRVCVQIGHGKADCVVVDLYTVENPMKYQNIMEQRMREQQKQQNPTHPYPQVPTTQNPVPSYISAPSYLNSGYQNYPTPSNISVNAYTNFLQDHPNVNSNVNLSGHVNGYVGGASGYVSGRGSLQGYGSGGAYGYGHGVQYDISYGGVGYGYGEFGHVGGASGYTNNYPISTTSHQYLNTNINHNNDPTYPPKQPQPHPQQLTQPNNQQNIKPLTVQGNKQVVPPLQAPLKQVYGKAEHQINNSIEDRQKYALNQALMTLDYDDQDEFEGAGRSL